MNTDSPTKQRPIRRASTIHPCTAHDQAAMAAMRAMVGPNKGRMRGVAARPAFDAIIGRVRAPQSVSYP